MKNRISHITLLLVSFIVMVACNENREGAIAPEKTSGVSVKLALDGSMTSAATRALTEDDYPITTDELRSVIKRNDQVMYSWESMAQMPDVVYLEEGDYTLTVQTNGTRNAINAVPYYDGETSFSITSNKVTTIYANSTIQSLAVSVTFADAVQSLTAYKMSYFNLPTPTTTLFTVTEAQNIPTPKKVYIDAPFAYGIKIEGKLGGRKWLKNVIQTENLDPKTYHNIIVK